jgi:hypothetical protein
MRGGVAVAVGAGAALLVAALAAMESGADRQPSADLSSPAAMPALLDERFEDPPSASEIGAVESLQNPVVTR